ncbi:fibronectin type III domain-containing protein [Hymenobacter negativus]|uniref:Fibronectin type III domain-containing protein n=1 Tax=Hymenobacter negativus TaxID=2795026 RepID=A0ABS3QD35_9BACT|nr:fibronectin type III domain-containing protein [Hymenobacter negativus]MBO2009161.1 fibronectin type III domain-containing protein [Hymenobacter negativus]
MSALTDTLLEQLNLLLASASDITASEHRAFEERLIAAIGLLEGRLRGNNIYTGELNGGAPDASLGIEGDLYVAQDSNDFFTFVDGQWLFLFNPRPQPSAFVPVSVNQYATHPAFATEREWLIWLTQHVGTGTVAPAITAPGQVPNVTATAGNAQAVVNWGTPSNNGGAAITGYTVKFRPVGAPTYSVFGSYSATTHTATVTGLGNGTAYQFTVFATSSAGDGALSTPATATPAAPSAQAPTITGFSPASGPVGQAVTITGTNFSGFTSLRLNGVAIPLGNVTASTSTSITFTLPAGATDGVFSITTPGGTASSSGSFDVTVNTTTYDLATFGDSESSNAEPSRNPSWPDIQATLLDANVFHKGTNYATPGDKILSQLPSIQNHVKNTTYTKTIAQLYFGINDAGQGHTTAEIIADLKTAIAAALATCDYVMLGTLTAYDTNAFYPAIPIATVQAISAEVRQWILTESFAFGVSVVVDSASDYRIGGAGAGLNTTYFTDGLHKTLAGRQVEAPLWAAGAQLLASGQTGIITGLSVEGAPAGPQPYSLVYQKQNVLAVQDYRGAAYGPKANRTLASAPDAWATNRSGWDFPLQGFQFDVFDIAGITAATLISQVRLSDYDVPAVLVQQSTSSSTPGTFALFIQGRAVQFRKRDSSGAACSVTLPILVNDGEQLSIAVLMNRAGNAPLALWVNGVLSTAADYNGGAPGDFVDEPVFVGLSPEPSGFLRGLMFFKKALTNAQLTAWFTFADTLPSDGTVSGLAGAGVLKFPANNLVAYFDLATGVTQSGGVIDNVPNQVPGGLPLVPDSPANAPILDTFDGHPVLSTASNNASYLTTSFALPSAAAGLQTVVMLVNIAAIAGPGAVVWSTGSSYFLVRGDGVFVQGAGAPIPPSASLVGRPHFALLIFTAQAGSTELDVNGVLQGTGPAPTPIAGGVQTYRLNTYANGPGYNGDMRVAALGIYSGALSPAAKSNIKNLVLAAGFTLA